MDPGLNSLEGDKPYTKEVKQDVFSSFFKGTTIKQQFFEKVLLGKCHFLLGGGPLEIFKFCKFLVIP